jgi:hypothetical protein
MSPMPASKDSQPTSTTETPASGAPKRGRRGRGRGRRGGGRSPRTPPAPAPETPVAETAPEASVIPQAEVAVSPAVEAAAPSTSPPATASAAPARPAPARHGQPRHDPLASAIAHAQHIFNELRDALAEMEEVIELLEIARTQKVDDEQQIATLRRALDQLQRGREQTPNRPERYRPRPALPPPAPGGSQS